MSLAKHAVFLALASLFFGPPLAADPAFRAERLLSLPEPILAMQANELGTFVLTASGSVWSLTRSGSGWTREKIRSGDSSRFTLHSRPRIHAFKGLRGPEIVFSTPERIAMLFRPGPGTAWSERQLHPGGGWCVTPGDFDPSSSGLEVTVVAEGDVLDSSFAYLYRQTSTGWSEEPETLFRAEVGTDLLLLDTRPDVEGKELWLTTEMGQIYERSSARGSPILRKWRVPLEEAAWVAHIGDIDEREDGLEIVYGSRYSNSFFIGRLARADFGFERLFTGNALPPGPRNIWSMEVGELVPGNRALELVGVDATGTAYLLSKSGFAWSTQVAYRDPSGKSLNSVLIGDFDPEAPGRELWVAGDSGDLVQLRATGR